MDHPDWKSGLWESDCPLRGHKTCRYRAILCPQADTWVSNARQQAFRVGISVSRGDVVAIRAGGDIAVIVIAKFCLQAIFIINAYKY